MFTDSLLILPLDILINIFLKLRICDLRNVMLTCKTLCDIVKHDNRIWRTFSINNNSIILLDNKKNKWFNELCWYDRCRVSRNWTIGCYNSATLIRHKTNYMPWLKFHDSEFLLLTVGSELVCYGTDNRGTPNCSRRLWKMAVPKITRPDVRTNDVSRFIMKNNILVCGNRDGCVAVYKLSSIKKRPQLKCHIKDCLEDGRVEVTAVELINNQDQLSVLTVSTRTPVMQIYTLRTNDNKVIPNNKNNITYITLGACIGGNCLSLNENKLAIGVNGNSRPLLFDLNTSQYLMTAIATEHRLEAIYDIQWHNDNTIAFVSHSGFLMLLDIRTHEVVYEARDPFYSTLYCVKTDGNNGIIVGTADESRCVLFDARRASRDMQMYFTQRDSMSPVYCLDFDSTKLITAIDRGIAVLNFSIGSTSQKYYDYFQDI